MPDIPLPKPQLPQIPAVPTAPILANSSGSLNPSSAAAPGVSTSPMTPTPSVPITPPMAPNPVSVPGLATSPSESSLNSIPTSSLTPPKLPSTLGSPPRSMSPLGLNNNLPTPPKPPNSPATNFTSPPSSAPLSSQSQKGTAPIVAKPPGLANKLGSNKKILAFVVGGIILLLIAIGAFAFLKPSSSSVDNLETTPASGASDASSRQTVPSQKTTITYWGLWESGEVLDDIFKDFETQNPGVEIVYKKQSHLDYRQRLQSAIASGNGPDIFRYHASWVPMLAAELSPLPSKIMTPAEYQKTFYPVASQQLQSQGQLVGIPLMYDGLALFYNKKVLETAGDLPPQTWTELKSLASKLTIRSSEGIKRSGLAIGNASTTEHFSDILALLILQNGADPADLTTKEAQEALVFYTNFVTKDKVWDEKLPSSTVAFARGDAAMMLAPSWRAHEVLAINPDLEFGIAPTPTLGDKRITWASYWAEGVSSQSKNGDVSWKLLKYLSSAEIMQKIYSGHSKTRSFGEIYSRVDLANSLAGDELVAPFLADAPYAKGWYLNSYTHDSGLNDNLIKYYQDAVNALLNGGKVTKVMETLSAGSNEVLKLYKIGQVAPYSQNLNPL